MFLQVNQLLLVLTLGTARLMACFTVFSPLGQSVITGLARNVLVLAFGLLLMPLLWVQYHAQTFSWMMLSMLMLKEVFLGLFIGFFASIIFEVIQSIGFLVDTQRGSSMGSLFDPTLGDQTSVLGSLLQRLFVFLFFGGGFFVLLLGGLYNSYDIWPILSFDPWIHPQMGPLVLAQMDNFMRLILVWSSPMLLAMLLVDVGFGLINRFAPQLNVFFLAMPVKSALSIFMLMFLLTLYKELVMGRRFDVPEVFRLTRQLLHP
jgi:type III secretion protein T